MSLSEDLRMADLIAAYLTRELTDKENKALSDWVDSDPAHRALFHEILSRHTLREELAPGRIAGSEPFEGKNFEETLIRAGRTRNASDHRRRRIFRALGYTALLVPAALLLIWRLNSSPAETGSQATAPETMASGQAQVLLIQEDGSRVELDLENLPVQAGKASVAGDSDGIFLLYSDSGETEDAEQGAEAVAPIMNTVRVQSGTHFKMQLSDRTTVHLDAYSELTYPVRFTGPDRRVRLKGKAYFEVAPGRKPFVVTAPGSTVTVYGTEFCLDDSGAASITTLVSGKVSVAADNGSWDLKPGQQIVIRDGLSRITEVETLYYTAWKDGYFMYQSTELGVIMTELARWYGVGFMFERQSLSDIRITARIKKYDRIDPVLDILAETNRIGFHRADNFITIKDET
ncbi:MAG: FecR family protein [Rikenellaceae bacterium]|nr:FecR family protein [Rikenellaceae bacterium]